MSAFLRLPLLVVLLFSFLYSVHSASYSVTIGWNSYTDEYGPAWYSLYFYPSQLTIVYGDSVTWTWASGEVHNLVFSNGTALADTSPDGSSLLPIAGVVGNQTHFTDYAQTYSSGIKNNNGAPVTLQFIPNTGSGNFTFYCSIHASMVGVISVLPAGSTAPLTPTQVSASTAAELATLEGIANTQIGGVLAGAAQTGPGVPHTTLPDGSTLWTVQAGEMWMDAGFAMYSRFIPSYLEVQVGDSVQFVTIGDDPHIVYFNQSNVFQYIYTDWDPTQAAPLNTTTNAPNPNYPLHPLGTGPVGVWPDIAGSLYSGLLFDPAVFPGFPFPQIFTVKFTAAGNWTYMCPIHYDIGMQAAVNVKPAGAPLCSSPTNPASCALLTNAVGVRGDPQFVGLLGQSFQVHGLDGAVYALISDVDVQVNARFAFLTGPRPCPAEHGIVCWSHDGSYLSELGLRTPASKVRVQAGSAALGFTTVEVDGVEVAAGHTQTGSGVSLVRHSTHTLTVSIGEWTLNLDNSDHFVNIQGVTVSTPLKQLTAHGLLGQTSRRVKGHIQGEVDDYTIASDDIFGSEFVYNKFQAEQQ